MDILLDIVKYAGTFLLIAVAVRLVVDTLNEGSNKPKKPNYKNIAVMADNLVKCSVSSRKKVLAELYDDEDWTKEEVDELKSVVEGMLNTKLFTDSESDDKGLKSI